MGVELAVAYDRAAVREVLDGALAEGRASLTAPEGRVLCTAYGIATPDEELAGSAEEAADAATRLGFPVVLKVVSSDILHKTEAGGVLVGLETPDAVHEGYERIVAAARGYSAGARIDGVQVQRHVKGLEVIVGAITDPSFGKLVAFGSR